MYSLRINSQGEWAEAWISKSRYSLTSKSNISKMVQDRTALTTAVWQQVVHGLLNGAIVNDDRWPVTRISRTRHYLTLNISETVQDRPSYNAIPRCVPKKKATWCLIITLANVIRLSKSFHQLIREKILYVHIQTSTSPAIFCYTTLWKSKIHKMLVILTASSTNCWHVPEDTWTLDLIFDSS